MMRFATRDFVTRESYWQIASLMTQKLLFTVTHALFYISRMLISYMITIVYTLKINVYFILYQFT